MRNDTFTYSVILLALIVSLLSCRNNNDLMSDHQDITPFEDPPEWAKSAIWYQIFIDRFHNGDPSNDPRPIDMAGAYPGFVPDDWQVTPWTHDWYQEDDYMKNLTPQDTDIYGNPLTNFGQKSQLRRYGGDLQGVFDKLDYLTDLGVNAIYFNPLNDAPSLHKYDARYWRHIDRNLGPNPDEDIQLMRHENDDDPSTWVYTNADQMFIDLIAALHDRGMRVILDFSFNHTGQTFWAWQDLLKHQANSRYKDWYWVTAFDNPDTEENEFDYRGWLGVKDLPEIKETAYLDHSEGLRPFEGNIYSEAAKQHIFEVAQRWLDPDGDGDPSDGVDGFRLDVAAEMPMGFWRDFRAHVRTINPDAYLVGELWWQAWPDQLLDPAPYLKGDIFDAPMNYRWYRAARHFFAGVPDQPKPKYFAQQLSRFNEGIRDVNQYAMMNLVSSHDTPRAITSLANGNLYKQGAHPDPEGQYIIHKPDADSYRTYRQLLAHQYTYIGAPHIWAGDEMGMWGSDDPSCRKPLIWPEMDFDDESTHPYGIARPIDPVRFDTDLHSYHKKLIQIRKTYRALTHGDIEFFNFSDHDHLLSYRRWDTEHEVFALFNIDSYDHRILIPISESGHTYIDLLTDQEIPLEDQQLTVLVPGRGTILVGSRR